MKYICWLLAAAVQVAGADSAKLASTASSASFTNLFPDKVIAKGKGMEVTRSQFEDAFSAYRASMAVQGQIIGEAQRAAVENQVLSRLINVQLLMAKSTAADREKAKESADKAFDAYLKRMPNDAAFKRQLNVFGMSAETFKARLLDEAIFKEVIDREIKGAIQISDEDAKKFYQENAMRFDQPEKVRCSHILILTQDPATQQELPEKVRSDKKELAEKVLKRLQKGEDFAGLAKDFSDDPYSRQKGGELPALPRGIMVREFDAIAFALRPGEISDLVPTKAGYHIIKLHEKTAAKRLSFNEAVGLIKDELASLEAQKRLPDYMAKLRAEAGVQILEPVGK
jgi:parvulin-like peptidyl-prolyl isomerase